MPREQVLLPFIGVIVEQIAQSMKTKQLIDKIPFIRMNAAKCKYSEAAGVFPLKLNATLSNNKSEILMQGWIQTTQILEPKLQL